MSHATKAPAPSSATTRHALRTREPVSAIYARAAAPEADNSIDTHSDPEPGEPARIVKPDPPRRSASSGPEPKGLPASPNRPVYRGRRRSHTTTLAVRRNPKGVAGEPG